jgi:hypothetical protein
MQNHFWPYRHRSDQTKGLSSLLLAARPSSSKLKKKPMTRTTPEPAKEADAAPALRLIDLDQIDTNSGTESRPLHDDVVKKYADAWKTGAKFPPVDLFWDGTRLHVGDGSHRIAGARILAT